MVAVEQRDSNEHAKVEIVADPASQSGWHLDRRVPAALIIAVMIQTAGIVWWAATLSAANTSNAVAITANKFMIDKLDDRSQKTSNDMADVKAKVDMVISTLDRQTDKLDQLAAKIVESQK